MCLSLIKKRGRRVMSNKAKIIFKIPVCIEPDGEGFYAYCPALKGVHVDGETKEKALKNVMEAIILYLKSLIKHGEPIPIQPISAEMPATASTCRKPKLGLPACPPRQAEHVLVTV